MNYIFSILVHIQTFSTNGTLIECLSLDANTLNGYVAFMEPKKLKELRETLNARQQDMAKILGVAARTYQNWEQPETSTAHRRIPDDIVERVRCLVELHTDQDGNHFPQDITWLQIPVRKDQKEAFSRASWQEDKSLSTFIQEAIFEKLNSPRDSPDSNFPNK